ncbi:TetR/AcrR family transcriptional regulator [Sporolactobacillus vineae]|uniref:TetR/AcrR family transcriptional regulator n=1 Tax=Sporolactobacillus vineae TaxID=444463 RepID=UPI0002888229|nr:TetR/AcrR family transcriptional regulator [Sporolactobacillus vineae]
MTEDQTLRAKKKKDQILRSAQKLFISKGFEATSMDEIRNLAGVSKQTIYSYYSGKEQLLFDVIEKQLFLLSENAFSSVLETLDFSTPQEVEHSLIRFTREMLDHFMQVDYLQLARVVVSEVVKYPELARMFREAVPLRGLKNVEKMLRKANLSDCVSIDHPEIAARSFVGTILTYVFIDGVLSDQKSSAEPSEQQIRQMVRFYLPSILAERQGTEKNSIRQGEAK